MYITFNTEHFSSTHSHPQAARRLTLTRLRSLIVVISCSFLVIAPVWASDVLGKTQALFPATMAGGESNKAVLGVMQVSASRVPVQTTGLDAPSEAVQLAVPEALNMDVVKAPLKAVRQAASTTVASATSVALVVTSAATVASNTVVDVAGAIQHGIASWYGAQFHNSRTASGERFNMNELTAAHRTLPFGTKVCAHSPSTGKSVIVRINDRGPFSKDRVIDFSKAAAQALGILHRPGVVALVDASDMRCSKG